MNDDVRKLLGGYATGTLTDAEQKALFEAALQDQALFEALADEESLREVLDDPANRAAVLSALTDKPKRSWVWRWVPAIGVVSAVAVVATVAIHNLPTAPKETAAPPAIIASSTTPATPASPASAVPAPRAPLATPQQPASLAKRKAAAAPVAQQEQAKPSAPAPVEVAQSVERKKEVEERQALSEAVPPPQQAVVVDAAPVELADRVTSSAKLMATSGQPGAYLTASVLRKSSSGTYVPADASTAFRPGETVRLELRATSPGTVTILGSVADSQQPFFSGAIAAGTPLVVPVELKNQQMRIGISMVPAAMNALSFQPRTVAGGVVGGVITGSGALPGGPPASAAPRRAAKTAGRDDTRKARAEGEADKGTLQPIHLDLVLKVE